MSKMGVFSLGGLGGLLPGLTSLLAVDLASVIDHLDLLTVGNLVGYAIRVVILIILGGTMALLNVGVQQPLTLVQLGIAAPALITAYINGAALTPPNIQSQHAQATISVIFVSPAKADEAASHQSIRVAGGLIDDVVRGLTVPLPRIQTDRLDKIREDLRRTPPPSERTQPDRPSERSGGDTGANRTR